MIVFLTMFQFLVLSQGKIHARILKSSIVNFAPVKLHHVVIVTTPSSGLYAVDFSHEENSMKTKLLLLLGKSVPGEVRVRKLCTPVDIDIDQALLLEWINMTTAETSSREVTNKTMDGIREDELRKYIVRLMEWNDRTMNLYRSNCQHFSRMALSKPF